MSGSIIYNLIFMITFIIKLLLVYSCRYNFTFRLMFLYKGYNNHYPEGFITEVKTTRESVVCPEAVTWAFAIGCFPIYIYLHMKSSLNKAICFCNGGLGPYPKNILKIKTSQTWYQLSLHVWVTDKYVCVGKNRGSRTLNTLNPSLHPLKIPYFSIIPKKSSEMQS